MDDLCPSFKVLRELTKDDLKKLAWEAGEDRPQQGSPLQKVKSQHHRLAQLLASGMRASQVSIVAGYSPSRISVLLRDPLFQDLISYYTRQNEAVYTEAHQLLAEVGVMALEEIRDRLDEHPEDIPMKDLRGIMESTLDRSIAPSRAQSGSSIKISFVDPKPVIEIEGESSDVSGL